MIEVRGFRDKKLVEYLQPGMKVLIRFDIPYKGMGDCVMFMPLYERLKVLYPYVEFSLYTVSSQQDYFGDNYHQDMKFDYVFYLTFYEYNMYDDTGRMSKPEICCVKELGIPFTADIEFTWRPKNTYSRFIGVSFQCNSDPRTNVHPDTAKIIWDCIKFENMIPIEITFTHPQFNKVNQPFPFIDLSLRNSPATIENAVSAIASCRAFVGVNTGTFCVAVSMFPERVLQLNTGKPFTPYKRINPINSILTGLPFKFPVEEFKRWIRCMRDNIEYQSK